jgi:hypothetical protein
MEKRLPWSSEFSPGTLEKSGTSREKALVSCLKTVSDGDGDRSRINEVLRQRFFASSASTKADKAARLKQQLNRANNVVIGMSHYGLVDLPSSRLTAFGTQLLQMKDDIDRNYAFARSILEERNGLALLNAVRDLRDRGEASVGLKKVRDELRRGGFKLATNNGDASKVRMWLELAEVIDSSWVIDEAKVASILGVPIQVLDEWSALTPAQQAFVRTLQRLGRSAGIQAISSPELIQMVRTEHGPIFNEGQVAAKVYEPLVKGGWIDHDVKKDGRGGKGGLVTPTGKAIDLDLDLADTFRTERLPPDLVAALGKSPKQVRKDLKSKNKHIKGIALELLAVNIAADLGLVPVGMRLRHSKTGGAEVDYIAEGSHLMYSRWIFQCKNTPKVDVGALSKEIGMATLLQCNVIVIATTGTVSSTVKKYADQVITTTPFQVVLVEGSVVDAYARDDGWNRTALREHFQSVAANALTMKRPQLVDVLDDLREDDLG